MIAIFFCFPWVVSKNREELKRTNSMGQTGFCENLRKSAVSCGFLRKSAPPKCCNYQEKRKSAKICENQRKTANLTHLSLLVCRFYFPLKKGLLPCERTVLWTYRGLFRASGLCCFFLLCRCALVYSEKSSCP